jgi:hypothetical protein
VCVCVCVFQSTCANLAFWAADFFCASSASFADSRLLTTFLPLPKKKIEDTHVLE